MPPDEPKRIQVITYEEDVGIRGGGMERVTASLDVGVLRGRFRDFISGLQSIIDVDESDAGPFSLTEIQFSAEIGANGDFKLMGAGVGVEASSAVTFVLKRKTE